jgi:hypothetical protein
MFPLCQCFTLRERVRAMEITDSIVFVTGMKDLGVAGSAERSASGGVPVVGIRYDRPGQGRRE